MVATKIPVSGSSRKAYFPLNKKLCQTARTSTKGRTKVKLKAFFTSALDGDSFIVLPLYPRRDILIAVESRSFGP